MDSTVKVDPEIDEKLANFHKSVKQIEKTVAVLLNSNIYESLTTREKIDYDLFMAYTFNTLYWLYLRTKGVNPQEEGDVKNQLNRVKRLMVSVKDEDASKSKPRLDQAAASRFIKHGIHMKKDNEETENAVPEPARKKTKLK